MAARHNDVTGRVRGVTRRWVTLTGLVALGACTSPNPTLYTLASVPGEVLSGAPRTIELRAISLARYLERSQIVRSSDDYRLDVLSNEWWGEPLDSMMGRIIQQNLTQRLPGATVFSENGAISSVPEAMLGVGVQRMDLNRGGQVLLIAQLSVSRRGTTAQTVTLEVRPASAATPDLVAAMSTAIGQLTDQAALMLTAR